MFVDKDGSISSKPGSYVVIDNGIASDDKTCKIEKSWGAAICTGDFGRLSLRASDGKPPPAGARFARTSGGSAITLTRNGRTFTTGSAAGFGGAGNGNTTIPSGAEIKTETDSSTLDLGLTELEKGAWVIFELPGSTTASAGAKLGSLDALQPGHGERRPTTATATTCGQEARRREQQQRRASPCWRRRRHPGQQVGLAAIVERQVAA